MFWVAAPSKCRCLVSNLHSPLAYVHKPIVQHASEFDTVPVYLLQDARETNVSDEPTTMVRGTHKF